MPSVLSKTNDRRRCLPEYDQLLLRSKQKPHHQIEFTTTFEFTTFAKLFRDKPKQQRKVVCSSSQNCKTAWRGKKSLWVNIFLVCFCVFLGVANDHPVRANYHAALPAASAAPSFRVCQNLKTLHINRNDTLKSPEFRTQVWVRYTHGSGFMRIMGLMWWFSVVLSVKKEGWTFLSPSVKPNFHDTIQKKCKVKGPIALG